MGGDGNPSVPPLYQILYFMVVPLPSRSSGSDSECYRELSVADEAEAEAVHRPGGQCPDSEWPQEDHGRGPAGRG